MNKDERFQKLLDSYKSNTKMNIILLLAEMKKMTVTQMADHIKVSRSNLYHFVSQLVDDGILNEPEVVPKDNYVEKYYTLNESLFGAEQFEGVKESFVNFNPDEIRSVLTSFLLGQAFNLKMLADKIMASGEDELMKIKESLMLGDSFLSYSVSNLGNHPNMKKLIQEIEEELEREDLESYPSNPVIRYLFVALPYL